MRLALWAALAAAALSLAFTLARVELTFDEAYYALWARWPQAGYLDHPPLVAWMIAASTALFGPGEFGVRAPFWLAGALTPALIWRIGWRLYGDREAASAAVLFWVGAPLAAGAPLATPDTPLVLFWTLALAGLVEVFRGRERAWALVGLAAGAAGLAKMTAGFLGAGVILALVVTPPLRRQISRPGPYIAAALALAVLSPFLVWNAAHGFATFAKQGGRLAGRSFQPRYLGEFVGLQLLLVNPLSAAAALYAAARLRRGPSSPSLLLIAGAAPALAYFGVHALHDRVQGNWLAPLYPSFALLIGRATARKLPWAPPAAAAIGLAVAAAAYLHLILAWPAVGPADPLLRVGGWRELAAEVDAAARDHDAGFVVAQGYAATSLLSYYGGRPVAELGEPERWTFRPPIDVGGDGLAFGSAAFEAELAKAYARVAPLVSLQRRVGGVGLETYVLFAVGGPRLTDLPSGANPKRDLP